MWSSTMKGFMSPIKKVNLTLHEKYYLLVATKSLESFSSIYEATARYFSTQISKKYVIQYVSKICEKQYLSSGVSIS